MRQVTATVLAFDRGSLDVLRTERAIGLIGPLASSAVCRKRAFEELGQLATAVLALPCRFRNTPGAMRANGLVRSRSRDVFGCN